MAMLDFLERNRAFSKKRIVLEADPHAESFYPRYGFATVSLKATTIPGRFMPICFTVLDYEELIGYVRKGNVGSMKILDHLMTLDREVYSPKANTLEYLYQLRKEDWRQRVG